MAEKEKIRLDKYLWAIRIFKTRNMAADACEKGKVKLNGDNCKAAKMVKALDTYDIKTEHRRWVIQVAGIIEKRVQYSEAINYYIDLTPLEELEKLQYQASSFNTGKRMSKVGRPTKKEKRDLDEFFGNEEE
jgi:ribosome-associated heat shock protein Hsp15